MTAVFKRLRVNGVDLTVSVAGHGIPLVWGHGLMGSMAAEDLANWFDWQRVTGIAQVIRYDARGHGTSGASTRPKLSRVAAKSRHVHQQPRDQTKPHPHNQCSEETGEAEVGPAPWPKP